MPSFRIVSAIAILSTLVLLATSCGDSSTGSQETATKLITASEGGEISLDSGVRIRIPPGALPSDLPVTISTASSDDMLGTKLEGADSLGQAFNIDISGATLSAPVTLEIPFDPDRLPADAVRESAFLAYFDGQSSEWVPVGGVIDADRGVIIVETDHLSWWNPFTWNWDAWIAVLKKTLSLRISDLVDAVQLLTTECVESDDTATVDNSAGESVIQGCISDDGLSVTNLKSFHIAVSISPPPSDPSYLETQIAPPGESIPFPPLNTDTPTATAYATFSQDSMNTFLVSLILRMLPGEDVVPNEGIAFIADGIGRVVSADAIIEALEAGHALGAAEGIVEVLTGDALIEAFAELAHQYGAENGVDMMTKWSKEGIAKVMLGVAAVDVIVSVTDFLANYFFSYETLVAFRSDDLPDGNGPVSDDAPDTARPDPDDVETLALQICELDVIARGYSGSIADGFRGTFPYLNSTRDIEKRGYAVVGIDHQELTPADVGNGVELRAEVTIAFIQRIRRQGDAEWEEYTDHQAYMRLRRINGVWQRDQNPSNYGDDDNWVSIDTPVLTGGLTGGVGHTNLYGC